MSVAEKKVALPSDAELEERFAALERAARSSLEASQKRRDAHPRAGRLRARLRLRRKQP